MNLRRTITKASSSTSSVARRAFASSSETTSDESLVKTALYDLHKDLGGDMVPFAGYSLPVLYKGENGGVMKEHLWCRSDNKSSLFDVSHMGQIRWHGADRVAFLEKIVVGDIGGLDDGSGCLSLVTNDKGGIIDDTVITKYGDYVYMVRIRCLIDVIFLYVLLDTSHVIIIIIRLEIKHNIVYSGCKRSNKVWRHGTLSKTNGRIQRRRNNGISGR